jgi:nucleoid-associated protein YgaU
MRVALMTTAIVIAAFAVWASLREPEALRDVSALEPSAAPGAALPDVATAPAAAPATPPSGESAPSYTTATSAERPLREHVVAEGETLASIAERHYGDAARADAIYEANRDQIRDPAHLHAGQTLVLP